MFPNEGKLSEDYRVRLRCLCVCVCLEFNLDFVHRLHHVCAT